MSTSSTEAIIDRVVAQLQTITNIGRVHDRVRLVLEEDSLLELLTIEVGGVQRLRSWLVHLGRIETAHADAAGRMGWNRLVRIEGYSDFSDATGSETVLVGLAETVIRELWFDAHTTKLGSTILSAEPPMVVDQEPKLFAGVVCSYVRLEMRLYTIEDFINP